LLAERVLVGEGGPRGHRRSTKRSILVELTKRGESLSAGEEGKLVCAKGYIRRGKYTEERKPSNSSLGPKISARKE